MGTQTHPHEQAEVSLLTATLLLFITIIELTCAHFCIFPILKCHVERQEHL